ncbi:MAG TPA: hypothetical protein VFW23_05895, partial [Tepidisphaeraceae bacterium]|nr:hypothetical protein [Tepidisphaeraceae bacterium]
APGRLDVMGGIADYTGSLVCELPIDRAAAFAIQPRDDRQLHLFTFSFLDQGLPCTFQISIDALASQPLEVLRREFEKSGNKWAAHLAGCLVILHEQKWIDLNHPQISGLNVALSSTIPIGAGLASSAAIEVAMMMALRDHFNLTHPASGRLLRVINSGGGRSNVFGPMELVQLCRAVENRIVGTPSGIMDQATSCLGETGRLMRMICQPHKLEAPLSVPAGVRFVGIDSSVKPSVAASAYRHTRCAAFMGHKIILEKMRQMGQTAGRRLVADPMRGYLANLDPDDYKRLFRATLPETMSGRDFIDQFGQTIDPATAIEPDIQYSIQHALDHHVLEARRVRKFAEFIEQACGTEERHRKGSALDRAGHLMYASHQSYSMDAMLGAPECDLLVSLARQRERAGIYGARITAGGCGGTVAILCDQSPQADAAIAQILFEYRDQTKLTPTLVNGSSPGAWHVGTVVVP